LGGKSGNQDKGADPRLCRTYDGRERAKVEIAKQLDGGLAIMPRPALAGERRRAEIRGRIALDGLFAGQGAACSEMVAGARNHRYRLVSKRA